MVELVRDRLRRGGREQRHDDDGGERQDERGELPLLVAEIKKQGIAEQISEKSVSRFLKMR